MTNPLVITQHARHAMMLRRVTIDEILEIVRSPEVTDGGSGRPKRFFKGRLCVVAKVERDRTVVVTVLYRYGERWVDDDVRHRIK